MVTQYIDERKGNSHYSITATEDEIAKYEKQALERDKSMSTRRNYNPKTESGKHWTLELHDELIERGFI